MARYRRSIGSDSCHRHEGQHDWSRRLVRESKPSPDDIVWGMIVQDGKEPRIPVKTMPGVDRLNFDESANAANRQSRAVAHTSRIMRTI